MFNFSKSLTTYGVKFEVVAEVRLTDAEAATISRAVVSASNNPEYNSLSIRMFLKSGGSRYITLSKHSNLSIGDEVDIAKGKILTLVQPGRDKEMYVFIED